MTARKRMAARKDGNALQIASGQNGERGAFGKVQLRSAGLTSEFFEKTVLVVSRWGPAAVV